MKCPLGISNFLEETSSFSLSIVFLYFFALTTEEGFLISPCYSLELCLQMGISFLFSFAFSFSFLSQLFVMPVRQLFCLFAFVFLGDGLDHCLLYNVMNFVYSSSGTLSSRSNSQNVLLLLLYNQKGFDLGHT